MKNWIKTVTNFRSVNKYLKGFYPQDNPRNNTHLHYGGYFFFLNELVSTNE